VTVPVDFVLLGNFLGKQTETGFEVKSPISPHEIRL
jgi:hypothetical protein